jgi:DHA1 family bicyclomycin/chloramphenicol resistance-like MFS transporter
MLVTGLGPIIAPQIGAGILRFTSWRGIFLALAMAGSGLLAIALWKVPETLPAVRRQAGSLRSTFRSMGVVARDRDFIAYTAVASLGFGAIFAYIAGSSFVLQGVYGVSPQLFGAIFGINAVGLVLGAQVNGRCVHRIGSGPLLTLGLTIMSLGSLVFLASVVTGWGGLRAILPALFVTMFGLGFVNPNAMALAMQNHPSSAGAASALLGGAQFLVGATVAPLAGIEGSHDAFPMGVLMAALAVGAFVVRSILPTRSPHAMMPSEPVPRSV